MALPVSFRWDEGFVARIDEARGDVPRSVFVRRAVEQALGSEERVLPRPRGETFEEALPKGHPARQVPAEQRRRPMGFEQPPAPRLAVRQHRTGCKCPVCA